MGVRSKAYQCHHALLAASVCALVIYCSPWFSREANVKGSGRVSRAESVIPDEMSVDRALQSAAKRALDGREGTVIVMDARTGRLRALINSLLAIGEAFPPGSTIKSFTALAAMRGGHIDSDARLLCREPYRSPDFEIRCPHQPRQGTSYDLAQALAHSCNYYFAKVGERLNGGEFGATLASFGFGARTGVSAAKEEVEGEESTGALLSNRWRVAKALGEDQSLLVTPMQLITAYTALVNGGHLFSPQLDAPDDFRPRERARLKIAPAHRATLIEGMRGAVRYGTAESAGLDALPISIFGKTGTSTASDGVQMQGWFVGFAAEGNSKKELPREGEVELAVLVFLKQAHGAECAEAAREVFAEYAERKQQRSHPSSQSKSETSSASSVSSPSLSSSFPSSQEASPAASSNNSRDSQSSPVSVSVRLVSEGVTRTLSLEEYLRGVLAAEASVEDEFEALKAQAVTSRTFALKNMNRHGRENYNFCSTTHCQRFVTADESANESAGETMRRRAIAETADEILRDEGNHTVDAYFHVACGGATADMRTLWGAATAAAGGTPTYARGVRDSFCATMPYRRWTDVIPATELLRALQSDARSHPGERLDRVNVVRRDGTGRAELVALEGERPRRLRGWDFKIIVGRALGWNLLKSSRFEVERRGANFVFRGGGFGHGLGLCQHGAHVMAERGAPYRQILNNYFPGTSIGKEAREGEGRRQKAVGSRQEAESSDRNRLDDSERDGIFRRVSYLSAPLSMGVSSLQRNGARGLRLSSENFRVTYPAEIEPREIEGVLRALEAARKSVARRVADVLRDAANVSAIEVIIHRTTSDFVAATGQPPWAGAATRGRRIELQPLRTLRRRGVLDSMLRHEFAHVVIDAVGGGRTPRWLAEGLAAHVAGEGAMLTREKTKRKLTIDEVEDALMKNPPTAQEMHGLYAASYREVQALIRAEGEASVWRRVAILPRF